MENYLLYENEDYRIEIDGKSHYFIDQVMIPYIRLKKDSLNEIFPMIVDKIKNIPEIDKREFVCWLNCPIFQRNRYAYFSEPFDIFEAAQSYIVDNLFLDDDYNEHEKVLANIYEEIIVDNENEKFIPIIFPEKVNDVLGCFIYIREKEIIIMFWTFIEDEDSDGVIEVR